MANNNNGRIDDELDANPAAGGQQQDRAGKYAIGLIEFLTMSLGGVSEFHGTRTATHGRRTTVFGILRTIVAGDGDGGARGRSKDGEEFSILDL